MPVNEIDHLLNSDRFSFDPAELRAKYKKERDKRIRTEGNEQYVEVKGDFSHYIDDPYIDVPLERKPLTDEVDALVVGGGFGGLLAGARLRQAGVKKIRLVEKGSDFGGTWYWNRYPGAMCDIESYIYLPLLEELGYIPKEKYTKAPEILEHSRRIAEHFDLYSDALLQTQVTEARWVEADKNWRITTNRDDEIRAKYLVMANGPLNRPKLPGIKGIDKFQGHTFHTSRWDYDYTGGDASGGLSKLKDKRVGVIGTGATAVQCIPHLGAAAESLFVFQRTPSSVDVRANQVTDTNWVKTLTPGWQKRRMENFNTLVSGGYEKEDFVQDGWTEIFRNLTGVLPPEGYETIPKNQLYLATELADFEKMEKIRSRVDSLVRDESTAEALKPYYRQFCKRPCFHDEYLETYNLPNVTLVDTAGKGVAEVTSRGVIVDGKEYELDCLIFATGFEVGTSYTRRAGYEVIGQNGRRLGKKWEKGPTTFHGMHSAEFPNCFFMGFIQTALTPNFVHLLLEQSKHIAHLVHHAEKNKIGSIVASQAAEDEWCATIKRLAKSGEKFFRECTPGYYNNEGKADEGYGFIQNSYGGGPVEFFQILENWREQGDMDGLILE